jgi:hypothetical protein
MLRHARGWLVLATLLLAAAGTLLFLLPGAVSGDAAPASFSAARVERDVAALAVAPRPAGSMAHAAARGWLVERLASLGLTVEVQSTLGVSAWYGMPFDTGQVHNVVARLPGRASAGAVLLVAHYDTFVASPGASDNGAGVAVALEIVRAIQAGPPLDADLVVLFTDLEEGGMVGAHAFVRDHAAARDVSAFINLDARGTSGPPVVVGMFDPEGALLAGLAAVDRGAASSSLYVEATRLLHGGTDFAVLARHGLPGVNIAFADGVSRYHTGADVPGAFDAATAQAEGELALGLVRRLGRAPGEGVSPRLHEVFFGLPVVGVVTLPAGAVRWSVSILLALAASVAWRRRGELRVGVTALRAAATSASAAIAGGVVWAGWALCARLHPVHAAMRAGDPYEVAPLRWAAVLCGLSAAYALRAASARWGARDAEQDAGALLVGVLAAAGLAVAAPAAGYALLLPMVVVLLAHLPRRPLLRMAASMVAAALLAFFGTQLVYTALVALELPRAGLAVAVVVLLTSWAPGVFDMSPLSQRHVALGAGGVALVTFASAAFVAHFDAEHPRPTCVSYLLDDTTGEALWLTDERVPAPSTRRLLPTSTVREADARLAPWAAPARAAPAPRLALAAPEVEVLAERAGETGRVLSLRLRSRRGAPWLYVTTDAHVQAARLDDGLNDIALPASASASSDPWSFRHVGDEEAGLLLELEVSGTGPVVLHVTDQSFELPPPADAPRSADTMACRSWWADSTLVSTSASL